MHLVSKKGMLPSLSGHSIVNIMRSSILLIWLNRMSTSANLCKLQQVPPFCCSTSRGRTYTFTHLVSFSYADYIIHIFLPPWCGNGALWSQCQFFKIFHVNICYDWWDWRTHCCSLKLLVKPVLE